MSGLSEGKDYPAVFFRLRFCLWTLMVLALWVSSRGSYAAVFHSSSHSLQKPSALGQPLATVLPDIVRRSDLTLSASRSLSTQRVTLVGKYVWIEDLTRNLVVLLSASPQESVYWTNPAARQWRLEEWLGRQTLAGKLRNSDVAGDTQHLLEQIAWATREGMAANAVDEFLATPLVVRFGAVTPTDRAGLVFSIRKGAGNTPTLELSVLRPDGQGDRERLTARLD